MADVKARMSAPAVNYQLRLDKTLAALEQAGERPELLLHSCCGPCSSYVLEYLARHFKICLFYYNPNIWPPEEYEKRLSEQLRLLSEAPFAESVGFISSSYSPEEFDETVRGLENEPEGGKRCAECFRLRLAASAREAKARGIEYFTTTLSVSPHKSSALLNSIGMDTGDEFGVKYLCSDFKKRNGYNRSIELSSEFSLYRQSYCGCRYSFLAGNHLK